MAQERVLLEHRDRGFKPAHAAQKGLPGAGYFIGRLVRRQKEGEA